MNRVDRLLALILMLQSRRLVTGEQMAARFELSVRTIYRDLAALGEAGVPIVAEAGVGYSLLPGYHLPPVNLTTEEASALVFADPGVQSQMRGALMKVRAILPREHAERLARLERGMATTAGVNAPVQADLSLLQQALADRRVLSFRYQSGGRGESAPRIVEPHGIIHYLERWHLIAWCWTRKDFRDFRTDRMTDAAASRETFLPREDFSVERYIRAMPTPALRAQVHFTASAADRAKREWWMGVVDEELAGNGMILTLAAVEWEDLVRWLLSFQSDATVLKPESLRKLLVQAAENAVTHHARKPGRKLS